MSILIVEDDDDLRDLVQMMLELEGFHVQTARHGQEALELVGETMPALILLDIKMPIMDGWSFAVEFRARHGCSAPILVMTAADHAASRAREVGAEGWIAKPFAYDDLLVMVRSYLCH
jgi:DNA-binding response OmpR family regulator